MLKQAIKRFSQSKLSEIFGPTTSYPYNADKPPVLNHFLDGQWVPVTKHAESTFFVPSPLDKRKLLFEHPKKLSEDLFPIVR